MNYYIILYLSSEPEVYPKKATELKPPAKISFLELFNCSKFFLLHMATVISYICTYYDLKKIHF